jgi:hypothetical protein
MATLRVVRRSFNCGGNWNNGANAGVFYANGNNTRTNTNANIGFRSALPAEITPGHDVGSSRVSIQNRAGKGAVLLCQAQK